VSSRVQVSVRVSAAPQRAFDVFTRDIALWWRPNSLFQFTPQGAGRLSFEGGVDGRLIETQTDGSVFEVGRVTAWEPGVRLAFGWTQASSPLISRLTSRCASKLWATRPASPSNIAAGIPCRKITSRVIISRMASFCGVMANGGKCCWGRTVRG